MDKINKFLNDLLNQRGLTKDDREDLRIELLDHILLLKQEYMDKGHTEEMAINLALKNFGDVHSVGNNIKRSLPSRNRYTDFSRTELFKSVLFMLISYFISLFCISTFQDINYKTITFDISALAIPIIVLFIYINLKLTLRAKRIKNLIISLVLFFITERIIIAILSMINNNSYHSNYSISAILLNTNHLLTFLVLALICFVFTSILSDRVVLKIRNPYNSKFTTSLLWFLSISLTVLYYLFPNRLYLLCSLVERIIGSEVTHVSKNLFFLVINYKIVVPNIGIIMLLVLIVLLGFQINKNTSNKSY